MRTVTVKSYSTLILVLLVPLLVACAIAYAFAGYQHTIATMRTTVAAQQSALEADDALLDAYSAKLRTAEASVTALRQQVKWLGVENAAIREDNAQLANTNRVAINTTAHKSPAHKRRGKPTIRHYASVEAWRPVVVAEMANLGVPKAKRAWLLATTLRCIRLESGGNPAARNSAGGHVGLLQLTAAWGPERVRLNGRANIRCFIRTYLRGGEAALARQWSTY